MKICFLAWTTFTHGGIPRVITTLANELCKTNEVTILCLKNNPGNVYGLDLSKIEFVSYEQCIFSKIRREFLSKIEKFTGIYKCSFLLKNYLLLRYPSSYRKYITTFINNHHFDVVVAASGMEESIFLGGIKNKINCKTVGWLHTSYEYYYSGVKDCFQHVNFNLLSEFYLKSLDRVVVLSKSDENKFFSKGVKSKNIYNPLATNTFSEKSPESKRMIFVGALSFIKGADVLIDGFCIFAIQNKDWSLNIYGEGPLKEMMEQKILENSLSDRITILPYTSKIDDEYDKSALMVFCSRFEGFGVVLLEAMSHGLPIAASDIPITRELIKEKNVGLLFESENPEALAEALLKMVDSDKEEYAKNGRKLVEAFTPVKIAQEWETMLTELIQK